MKEELKAAPMYEVYSIKREEVIQLIEENQGELRCLVENWGVGKDFVDYCYFVSKKSCGCPAERK